MDDEAEESQIEPAAFERQPLGLAALEAHGRPRRLASNGEHLFRRVDTPDTGTTRCEGLRETSGATPDVEGPLASHAARRGDESLEELEPVLVDGPKPVVGRRQGPEVGARRGGYASPISSSGSVIASMACCAASSEVSATRTLVGASSSAAGWCSTAASSSDSIPADWRIDWISSASVRSRVSATCTMLDTGLGLLVTPERPALD
jgi:hypothetical protein